MGLFNLLLQLALGNPSQICSLSADKSTLPKFLHTRVDICRDTEKCKFYSLGSRFKTVQQKFLVLLIWSFLFSQFTKLCNNNPTINYKNVFGIRNLNNFIVKRPTYVKVVLSYCDKNTLSFVLTTGCYDRQVVLRLLFGNEYSTEFNISYVVMCHLTMGVRFWELHR